MNEKYRLKPGLGELADMTKEEAQNYECEAKCKVNGCSFREPLVYTEGGLVDVCARRYLEEESAR